MKPSKLAAARAARFRLEMLHAIRHSVDLPTYLQEHVNINNAEDVLTLAVLDLRKWNHDHISLSEEAHALGGKMPPPPLKIVLPDPLTVDQLTVEEVCGWVVKVSKNVRHLMGTKEWLEKEIDEKRKEKKEHLGEDEAEVGMEIEREESWAFEE